MLAAGGGSGSCTLFPWSFRAMHMIIHGGLGVRVFKFELQGCIDNLQSAFQS